MVRWNAVFSFDTCLGAQWERVVTVVYTHWFTPESMCAAVCACSRAASLFSVSLSWLQPYKVMPHSQLVTVFIFALLLPFSPLHCSPRHPHTHPVFDFCWLTHEMLWLFKEFFKSLKAIKKGHVSMWRQREASIYKRNWWKKRLQWVNESNWSETWYLGCFESHGHNEVLIMD